MNRDKLMKCIFLPGIFLPVMMALSLDFSAALCRAVDLASPVIAADPDPEEDEKPQNPPEEEDPKSEGSSKDEPDEAAGGEAEKKPERPRTRNPRVNRPNLGGRPQKNPTNPSTGDAQLRPGQDPKAKPGRPGRAGQVTPPTTRPPRTTPRQTPTKRTGSPGRPGPGAKPGAGGASPSGETTTLEVEPTLSDVPPEEKIYAFSIADGTYEQLVTAFARQTGLGVIGEAPKDGKVNFVTDEELPYDKAFSRVRMLLRNYKPHDPYYLIRHEKHLEVVRVNDYLRKMPPSRMYRTVADFRTANLPVDELVLVIYTPESGSVADLQIVRDFMADYLRVAPIEDRNSVTIYAFVDDVDKYFEFVGILVGEAQDPRTLLIIPIEHIPPSEALTKLQALMDLAGASRPRTPTRRSGGKDAPRLGTMAEPDVTVVPDDVRSVLIVRAMKDKIEEINLLLPFIDVAQPVGIPVVILVEHADPADLIETIQQIIVATSPSGGGDASKPSRPSGRGKKSAKGAAARSAKAGHLTMIVHPSEQAIIAIGDEDEVAEVRKYVAQFDKPAGIPVQISLQHASATELAGFVTMLLGAEGSKTTPAKFHLIPDPNKDEILIFTGRKADLTRVREIVAIWDVPQQEVELRIVELTYQLPSFVANMLREYEQESAPSPTVVTPTPGGKSKKQQRSRRRPATASKFTPDDEKGILYVLCTDEQWVKYEPVVNALEAAATSEELFIRIPVEHVTPEEAIEGLLGFFVTVGQEGSVRYMPTDRCILVTGATPTQLDNIKEVLAVIDQPLDIEERTFVIRYAEMADIKMAIDTLVGNGGGRSRPPRKTPAKPGGAKARPAVTPTVTATLTMLEMGNRLIVRATPEKMEQIAALIEEFDVELHKTEIKVYDDFPPGAGIEEIAENLKSLFAGAKPIARSGKSAGGRSAAGEAPRFIPQQNVGKLVVIARADDLPEIERFLEVFGTASTPEPVFTEFIEINHADPEELVEQITPLLNIKLRELAQTGELDSALEGEGGAGTPSKKRRPGQPRSGNNRYHMLADVRSNSIVITAEQRIIDEVRGLIAQFDRPGEDEEVVVRLVELENAAASEIVKAIKEMRGAPSRPSTRKVGKKKTPSSSAVASTDLTITDAPGGQAVVLRGEKAEVEEVVDWIGQLDARATSGRTIKVYEIVRADIVKLGEFIINNVEARVPKAGSKAPRPRGKKVVPEEDEEFSSTKTWIGDSIYIQADLIARTLVVATSPAKIAQIDEYVDLFDSKEGVPSPAPMPSFTYELKYADAMEAAFDVEMVIEQLWAYSGELPTVEEAFWGNTLVIKYPYEERFDEIRELIAKHVDVRDPEKFRTVHKTIKVPAGMTAQELALLLEATHSEVNIEVRNLSSGPASNHGLEQVKPLPSGTNPCVLPTAFSHMVDGLAVATAAQTEPAKEDENASGGSDDAQRGQVEGKASADSDDALLDDAVSALLGENKLTIEYNDEEGVIYITGYAHQVEDVPKWIETIDENRDPSEAKADIRVYRVRYIDVNSAADIINEMYNATRQMRQMQQQQARLQAQRNRQAQAQQRRQQPQQGKQEPEGQQQGRLGRRGVQQSVAAAGQLPPTAVRVYANERDRTLILRADTSQYPALLELLATIDQPKPIDSEMRIFHLKKLNAAEVEAMLKDILGLGEQPRRVSRGRRSRAGGQGGATVSTSGPGSQLPETIMQETKTGGGVLGIDPEDISLHSNEMANTIIAMAPRVALYYIEGIIKQLESEEIRERIARYYQLEHAEADDVAGYLETYFAEEAGPGRSRTVGKSRKGGKGSSSRSTTGILTAPTFMPYPRLRMLTVLALEDDFSDIEDIIKRLDVKDDRQWEHVVLKHADAKAVADTLTQMFTGKRVTTSQRGGRRPTPSSSDGGPVFIGEEGSRMLIYTAPSKERELIHETIARLESQAEVKATVRIIPVLHAKASELADAIQAAYGGSRSRGRARRGGGQQGGTQFTVTGDDPTKTLFVVADDTMFAEIESLVQTLDTEREPGFEFRIYPLKYADARQVHTTMTKLMADYMRRLPRGTGIEAFSVEVDDKANALIALGGPVMFGFIEKNLAMIDTPAYARSLPGFLMMHLKNGDATEVAQNINRLWGGRNLAPGELPPTAEANRSLNMLIVRGTEAQLAEIKSEVIDPLEAQESLKLQSETITLNYAQPEAVAESINRIFEDLARVTKTIGRGANTPPLDYTVIVTPLVDTQQVIVQASTENLERIRILVADLDREEVAAASSAAMKIYPIKYADPNAVVNIINQWARSRSQGSGRQRSMAARDVVTAVAEHATQSVVVTASESNHMIIQELIDGLDDESVATRQRARHVLKLTHASAAELANQLTQIFRNAPRRSRGDQGPSFVADPKTNAIVATVNDEELAEIRSLLAEIDMEPPLEKERVTEVYPLRYADPGSVNGVILNMFRWDVRSQPSPAEQVTSHPEWATQSVIVTAAAKKHAVIKAFIEKVDVESTLSKEVHTYKLQHASAEEVSRALQQVYRGQRSTRRGEQPVQVTPDTGSNSLLISATQDEMVELTVLIESLDVEPDLRGMQQVKSIHLKNADPYIAQEAITKLFRGGRSPRDQVAAIGDHQTSSVVVASSPANMKRIEAFLLEFDSEVSAEQLVHVVTLENADAESMARTLTEVFIRSAQRPRGGPQPISISSVGGSKALLVKCNEQDFADIQEAVDALDSEAAAGAEEIRVVTLLYGDAAEMQRAMQETLQKPSGRGKELVGNIKLAALPGSNALVVSGGLDRVNDLEETIKKLDEAAQVSTEPQLIPLTHVRAGQILPTLQETFVDAKGRGTKGRMVPIITSDETQKTLIVRAGRADVTAIRSLVEKLDTEEAAGGTNFRIVQLAVGVNVTDLAEMVEQAINEGARARSSGKGRGQQVPTLTVTPDRRTISLVMSGSPELFDDAEALARKMEDMGPSGGRPMTVISLKGGVPADELTRLIEQLRGDSVSSTRRSPSSSRNRSSGRRPSSGGSRRRP